MSETRAPAGGGVSGRLKIARRAAVPPFQVMAILAEAERRAAAGADVIHLEVGQPATAAPLAIRAAAHRALDADKLGYTQALGLPALRAAIAGLYRQRYGLDLDPARVAVTVGSSGAFLLAFLAAFEPGDRVALATPFYPAYRNILTALGVEAVLLPTRLEDGFQPSPEILDAVPGPLAGLILASPANPTGSMLAPDRLNALAAYCARRQLRLISDELYHGVSYGPAEASALAADPDAVVIGGFSKYYAMTGWRLGWMILPPDLVEPVEALAQNLFLSPPALAQHAALAAFLPETEVELRANVARYARNRDLLLEGLPKLGFTRFAPPDGAFYFYADCSGLADDSVALCRQLLAETSVAMTPGVDFDPVDGHRFLRISFAGAPEEIAEALRRLTVWRDGLRRG